jgi:transposase
VTHYAAIDVSLELSSVCIIDATGKVVKESELVTHPDALVKFLKDVGLPFLTEAGLETVLVQTRRVKKVAVRFNRQDRSPDTRGMAQLLRRGWFRPVHAKSIGSQEVRALLVARKQLQHKLTDIERSIRGILRGWARRQVGKAVLAIVRRDEVTRRFMTTPGVGAIVAIT